MNKQNITCPHCGKKNTWTIDNSSRPFCSERCKLIDLGQWADEQYKIPLEDDADSSENSISSEDEDKE